MIIVEGGDNVGKSTLIAQLIEMEPSLRLLKRERFKPSKGEGIGTSYLRALLPSDGDRYAHASGIADRLIASEHIYGSLFRDGSRISKSEEFGLRQLLLSYGALIVHCDPPDASILATWAKRAQTYDDPTAIARAYRAHLATIFEDAPIMTYDWTQATALAQRTRIIAAHRRTLALRERAHAWWSAMPEGAGQLINPSVLLVGESPSPRAQTPVPFAHGPAGEFLYQSLRAVRHPGGAVRHCYVTNAQKRTPFSDAVLLREEWSFLQPRVVVSLGVVAAELCRAALPRTARIVELAHPMYWRRFHWQEQARYVAMLADAIVPVLENP